MHFLSLLRGALLFALFCVCATVTAQNFSIQNGRFIDPDGNEYIPIGANVNVWNYYDWQQNIWTQQHQDIWTDCWRFNFMRAPVYMNDLNWFNGTQNTFQVGWINGQTQGIQKLRDVVNIYTPKKVVVMFDAHDFICRWPSNSELEAVKDYFRTLAIEFKDNPYVWFNLFNEPGFDQPTPDTYRYIHQEVIKVIRDEVGAQNMIVATGSQCGMEAGSWSDDPIWEPNSAFLTYGDDLINFNGKTYGNIAFDLHMYDQWAFDMQTLDNKLRDFLTKLQARGYAVLIGEVGSPPETGSYNSNKWSSHARATELAYNVALKEFGIGIVQWHWDPEDDFTLIDGPHKFNRGIDVNDCSNPTNLSYWGGYYFWQATHVDGYGLGTGTPPPGGGSGNIKVRARMASGSSDDLQFRVNDNTVHTFNISGGSYQTYSFNGSANGNIKLYFPDNGTDLQVEYLEIDGTKYFADQYTNTSAWNAPQSQCGDVLSTWMHCPGHIDFGTLSGPPPPPPGGGSGNVKVRVRMASGASDELQFRVDDNTVHTFNISGGDFDIYTYNGSANGNLKLYFPDNGTDLEVDYLEVDGTKYYADQYTNTSAWNGPQSRCGEVLSKWMHCPGYIDFGSPGSGGGGNPTGGGGSGSLVTNFEFDLGTQGWSTWGPAGLSVVTNAGMSGTNAGKVDLSATSNLWNVGLSTGGIQLTGGVEYEISFIGRSSVGKSITLDVNRGSNWQTGFYPYLTTGNQTFTFDYTPSATGSDYVLNFLIGGAGGSVWIDKVVIKPKSGSFSAAFSGEELAEVSIYPNPSNGSFTVEVNQPTQMNIYDQTGRAVLRREFLSEGRYRLLTELPAGIYLSTLTHESGTYARRLVVRK